MSRVIKYGIIGNGRIGRSHAQEMAGYPGKFELVACADHAPERRENLPKEYANAEKYASLEEMLKNDAIEMVTIATRHPDHVPMALQIMAAGKIAVVEKPVACSTAEMELLRQASAKHPGKLFFRHNRRFEAAFIKVRELCDSGLIGDVQYIKLYRSVGYCRRNDWMTMTEFFGGLLSNWGPHLIDQALCFLDSPVTEVWADVRRVISIGDGDDIFKIILRGANGRLADVEVAGCNAMPGREMEIVGSKGTIVFNGGPVIDVRHLDPATKLVSTTPHPENAGLSYGNFEEKLYFVEAKYQVPAIPMSIIWSHLYDAVVNGVPFPVTFDQAYNVVKVTEQAFAKSGFAAIKNFKSKA